MNRMVCFSLFLHDLGTLYLHAKIIIQYDRHYSQAAACGVINSSCIPSVPHPCLEKKDPPSNKVSH